jgi:hypothetical protein
LQLLALALAQPAAELHELEAKYPTAALVTRAFRGRSWHLIKPGTAELVGLVRPWTIT